MAAGVFVSYRRDDDPGWAGRVRDALAARFGPDRVFFDVDSIRGGQRWEQALDDALAASGTLVLVIGPRWLQCLQERQAAADTDFHLREITVALDRGINVYSVRVQGAPMPDLEDLPEVLRDRLPAIQWVEIYDRLFTASMEQVIEDIEGAMAPEHRPKAAEPAGRSTMDAPARADVTVGPWGTDADFHEIADALAAVAPSGTIRVFPGRYLKRLELDRPVTIAAEGRGDVLLDTEEVPCIRSRTASAIIRGLKVKTSAPMDGIGIVVDGGDLLLDGVRVEAHRPPTSTGIEIRGKGTRLVLGGGSVTGVAVGLRFDDGAGGRIERLRVDRATEHALVISGGSDPVVTGCSFIGGERSTVLADGGAGTVDDSALGTLMGSTIEVRGGATPTFRGSLGTSNSSGALGRLPDRFVRSKTADRPVEDDPARGGWTVIVADGGSGRIEFADLATLRIETAADPVIADCSVSTVVVADHGRGTVERSTIGQVQLGSGADPTFRDGCTIAPDRGVKVTVEVRSSARGTFEDSELVGRNVRDGSADPCVLVDGGSPVLRRCTVKNPGEGAVWVSGGGEITLEAGEVRSSVSGPALVVAHGTASIVGGSRIRAGLRIGSNGSATIDGAVLEADPVSGAIIEVQDDGVLALRDTAVRGAGFAAARKVGKWLEKGTEKVRGKVTSIPGSTAGVRLAAGARASFHSCDFNAIDRAELDAVAGDGVTFEGCELDGSAYP